MPGSPRSIVVRPLRPQGADLDPAVEDAVVAIDRATSEVVGVARYVRHGLQGGTADIALAVAAAHEGRGVGAELTAQLTERAAAAGVRWFTAPMYGDDAAALLRIENDAPAPVPERHAGVVDLEIPVM
jgi:GNAT superfamily N-acetyltransferase